MTWTDRYQGASFRGVAFFVESHEAGSGRRLAEFEFVQRDAGQVDDLGKKMPRYRIRAFTIGDDYDRQRDSLVAACVNPSTVGTLVHPYLSGSRQVRCASCTVREAMSRGGIAEIDLEFVLAAPPPAAVADTSSSLIAGIVSALKVLRTAFALAMLVADNPSVLITAALGLLGAAAGDLLQSLTGFPASMLISLAATIDAIADQPDDPAGTADALSAAFMGVADAAVAAQAALPDPSQAIDPVVGIDATSAAPSDPSYGLAAMASWAGGAALSQFTGATAVVAATASPLVTQQLVNQQAIIDLVCDTAVLAMASIYTQTAWPSSNAAAAARQQLLVLADARADAAAAAGSQPRYTAWLAVAALATADLTQQVQQLPRLAPYATTASLPALALAQLLYADAGRAADLVALNDAVHPLFMPLSGRMLTT